MVIADSTPRNININQIKRNIDTSEESIIFKRFPGHTADEISHYAAKPLYDNKPKQVIVIAGTNDLSREVFLGNTVNEHQVVGSLLTIARTARDAGAEKVHISGILVRHGRQYQNAIKRINQLLEVRCSEEGFIYMDQSEILPCHISMDGIHPNFYGTTILKMNILSCFYTFNPYFTDFDYDYERAIF